MHSGEEQGGPPPNIECLSWIGVLLTRRKHKFVSRMKEGLLFWTFLNDNTLVTCFIIERNSAVYGIIIQLECITKYNKLQCVCVCVWVMRVQIIII